MNNTVYSQSTQDYERFTTIVGNRPLNRSHLLDLIETIQEENLLEYNPIIVNENDEVIDGQHRLAAARELAVPIFYIVMPGGSLSQIQKLNSKRREWVTAHYLDSFIQRGFREYVKVRDFADEYRISVSISIDLLSGMVSGGSGKKRIMKVFRDGNFVVADQARAEGIGSLLGVIRSYSPDSAWRHVYCMRAAAVLFDKGYSRDFENKLRQYGENVTRRQSTKDYIKEFENILSAGGEEISLR